MLNGLPLPYSRHAIDEDDIAAVTAVLRGDWLTTGPSVRSFEEALAAQCEAPHAISCSNGTAALHLANLALGIGPDHSVIVPTMTCAATANAARHAGAEVVFADCDPTNGLMGLSQFEEALARARKNGRQAAAVFPVDLAGQCVDIEAIAARAHAEGMTVVEDSCHALGTRYRREDGSWHPVGACIDSDITVFSFHPVKTIAAGEGGAALTRNPDIARRLAQFRNHGVNRDADQFKDKEAGFDHAEVNPWYYEMTDLGLNYRLSDINAALAHSQLKKLGHFVDTRRRLAAAARFRSAKLHGIVLCQVEDREEKLRLLRTGNRVLTGEDKTGDRADAEAAGVTVFRDDLLAFGGAGEKALCFGTIESGLTCNKSKRVEVADIMAFKEIAAK